MIGCFSSGAAFPWLPPRSEPANCAAGSRAVSSWSLAPKTSGGFGLDLAAVSRWLGHSKRSITQDTYLQPPADALDTARRATLKFPGTVGKGS